MDTILTNDKRIFNVANDTDFLEIIEEYIGRSAAYWYQERISRVDDLVNQILEKMNPIEKDLVEIDNHGNTLYHLGEVKKLAAVGKLDIDTLADIASIALEIPRWDE